MSEEVARIDKASEEFFAEVRDRYKKASEFWAEDKRAALDDLRFSAGEQWPEALRREREQNNRPALVVDKLDQYVRQIVNDGRQNRPSIKVRPVDGGADVATAKVLQGLIRHIEDNSNADTAYDTALEGGARCGQGYFRALTDYAHDETFEQEIFLRRIRNHLSVTIDPMTQEADGSDMGYCYIEDTLAKADFKAQYPKAATVDWEADRAVYGDWFGEQIRICEYWWVEETPRTVHLLSDGTNIPDDTYQETLALGLFPPEVTVVESRDIPKRTVKWAKVSGKEFLEGPTLWPGKWIPIFPVWGNELDVEGKVMHSGLIRPGKDPQRLYNYSRSAFAERVALTPKTPWVAAEGQVEDYEKDWATANVENHSVLKYKPTSLNGAPVPPPQRSAGADIPQGFAQDMQLSEHDIQAALGMYNASLGAPSNERSGKAILARQREGDTGTYHYHDNLNRAIRHCGRVLVDLIPKIYDTKRVLRVLGEDGKPGEAQIDPQLESAVLQRGAQTMYNLAVGKYDVTLSSGPSYNTLRQEAAASMTEMVQANPALMQVVGDLMVKAMDWPGADDIAERLKIMLPPEIKQMEEAKAAATASPEVQRLQMEHEQVLAQKDEMMGQAVQMIEAMQGELKALQSTTEVAEREVRLKAIDTKIKAYEADTRRLQVVGQAMTPQQIQAIVMQTMQDLLTPDVPPALSGPVEQEPVSVPEAPANNPPQGLVLSQEQQPNV